VSAPHLVVHQRTEAAHDEVAVSSHVDVFLELLAPRNHKMPLAIDDERLRDGHEAHANDVRAIRTLLVSVTPHARVDGSDFAAGHVDDDVARAKHHESAIVPSVQGPVSGHLCTWLATCVERDGIEKFSQRLRITVFGDQPCDGHAVPVVVHDQNSHEHVFPFVGACRHGHA
jgi:hypothetical protein